VVIKSTIKYIEASTLPTREEAVRAQKICCGRVCSLCESPAEYAWRSRTVDLAMLVTQAVEQDLTETERETVTKYWYDDMTLTEIAAETGRAPPNVARTLERAHKKLFSVLRYVVQYQHNLESINFAPLAVRKALMTAAMEKQNPESCGERIKRLRVKENIPAQTLAGLLEMPKTRLLSIEKGKILPNAKELLKIAAFFNTTIDYILNNERKIG